MSLLDRYNDFGALSGPNLNADAVKSDEQETLRLEAFENGYQAGWEDSSAAQQTEREKVSFDLAQSLQDLSFTYHEAYAKLSLAMKPLLTKCVTTLLPQTLQSSLSAQIISTASELVKAQSEGAIEIAVSPQTEPVIRGLLEQNLNLPFNLKIDQNLLSGQVRLQAKSGECEINLDALLDELTTAIDAFFEVNKQDILDG